MTGADIAQYAGAVTGALAAIAGIGLALRWVRRRWLDLEYFLDDWRGEAARPGVPQRPGVPERLAAIEAELRPNSGHSLRDAIDRTEASLADHLADHEQHHWRKP